MNTSTTTKATLADLITGIHVCMLTTTAVDGHLRSRPMALQALDAEGVLWFFVDRTSQLAGELRLNPRASATFIRVEDGTYIAIDGRAITTDDRDRLIAYWHEDLRVWFPRGLSDPNLIMLRIVPEALEAWTEGGHLPLTAEL